MGALIYIVTIHSVMWLTPITSLTIVDRSLGLQMSLSLPYGNSMVYQDYSILPIAGRWLKGLTYHFTVVKK
jgi:hypothetical protein